MFPFSWICCVRWRFTVYCIALIHNYALSAETTYLRARQWRLKFIPNGGCDGINMSYIFKAPTKVCLASNPEFYQIRYTTLYKGARASTDRQTDTGIHTVKHRHKQIWSWYDANIFIFLCVKDWTVNIKIRPKKINIGQKCKNLQFSSKLKKKTHLDSVCCD